MSGHSRQRVRHPWLVVALLFASTAGALWLFFTGPGAPALGMALLFVPETSGDRERILRALELPEGFELLAIGEDGGTRSGLAGAPRPSCSAVYSAPWEGGELCARVEELARKFSSTPIQARHSSVSACSFAGSVSSGWRARILNEWRYNVGFTVLPPGSPSYGLGWQVERLPPDRARVAISLSGKQGW